MFRKNLLSCALAAAAWTAVGSPAAADESFFAGDKAQAAIAAIFDKAGHPTKVLSLEIGSHELTVEVQDPASPRHIDAWTDRLATGTFGRLLYPESISGPRAVEPNLIDRDLDANLIPFRPADMTALPALEKAAIARAALEGPAAIVRVTLKRKLFLIPVAKAGAPEWQVEVSSGREHAVIYADLGGRVTHANLDGTQRAQRLDYLAGGGELDAVVAALADVLGKGPVIRRVVVYDRSLSLEALDPDHPGRLAQFGAGLNGVYRNAAVTPVTLASPPEQAPGLFAIGEVNWALVPRLQQAARDRLGLPGGRTGLFELSKPGSAVGPPQIEWEVSIESAVDPAVGGRVVFDAKGNPLRTTYPPGKGPKLDLLQAASFPPAVSGLTGSLGAHAAVVELDFRPDVLRVTAKDPQKPDDIAVFEYRGESVARSMMPPLRWPTFGPDWFFDLAQASPLAARWAELQRDTLSRLGLPDGRIDRITISKQKMLMPGNDRVLVEIRAAAGRRDGRVLYDLSGEPVEVFKP